MEKVPTTARLEARLPADIHALLKRAAEIEGRSLTDFVVSAAREAARRTIEETEIMRLSVEDQRQIAEAILTKAKPLNAGDGGPGRIAKTPVGAPTVRPPGFCKHLPSPA